MAFDDPGLRAELGLIAVIVSWVQVAPDAAFNLVGHFKSSYLLPVAGNDALPAAAGRRPGSLCVNGEVWQQPKGNTAVLQLRSRHVRGHGAEFAADVLDWAKEAGFAAVVCLTGADALTRTDAMLAGSQLRHVATPAFRASELGARLSELCWGALEPPRLSPSGAALPSYGVASAGGIGAVPLPSASGGAGGAAADTPTASPFDGVKGTGLARRLFEAAEAASVPLVAPTLFVCEGDNRSDGALLASAADALVHVLPADTSTGAAAATAADGKAQQPNFVEPPSWAKTYNDSRVDRALYL